MGKDDKNLDYRSWYKTKQTNVFKTVDRNEYLW